MIDLKDTTFAITIRIDSEDRMRNITTVLCYLLENFDTNIILKEVDRESVCAEYVIPQVSQFTSTSNLHHIFEESHDPVFHKTKIINEMFRMADTPVVASYDCDILLPLHLYKESQDLILNDGVDVVYPFLKGNYNKQVKMTDKIATDFITNGFSFDLLDDHSYIYEWTAKWGFCQFYNKDSYFRGGGYNEQFKSYAPEDQEIYHRLNTLGFNIKRIGSYVYHMFHTRNTKTWFHNQNPHTTENRALWARIQKMDRDEMIEFFGLDL